MAAIKGRWDRAYCLGDLVDYGPDPNEVTEFVRELSPTIIRGNHDKAVAGVTDLEDFNPVARVAAQWTRTQMHPANLDYFPSCLRGQFPRTALPWFMDRTKTRTNMCSSPDRPWAG